QEGAHSERRRGDRLVAIDREDAAADDLGAERRLVQREADHRRRKAVEPDPDRWKRIVQEYELQQLRGAANEPNVRPSKSGEHAKAREPQQREPKSEHDAPDHGQGGDPDGKPRPIPKERLDDVAQKLPDPGQGAGSKKRRADVDPEANAVRLRGSRRVKRLR